MVPLNVPINIAFVPMSTLTFVDSSAVYEYFSFNRVCVPTLYCSPSFLLEKQQKYC